MVTTSALRLQGSQEEFYTELHYFMTEAADKPIHLLDPDVDRSLPEFEECRLEWSWVLIGTQAVEVEILNLSKYLIT
jgi:hypothetical protein